MRVEVGDTHDLVAASRRGEGMVGGGGACSGEGGVEVGVAGEDGERHLVRVRVRVEVRVGVRVRVGVGVRVGVRVGFSVGFSVGVRGRVGVRVSVTSAEASTVATSKRKNVYWPCGARARSATPCCSVVRLACATLPCTVASSVTVASCA